MLFGQLHYVPSDGEIGNIMSKGCSIQTINSG